MPSSPVRRSHLRGLWSLLAVLSLLASSAAGALAQDAAPAATPVALGGGPALGDAVVLFDNRGDELAQVAVVDLVDPYEETDSDPQRGFHYVAIEVVVENLGEELYQIDSFNIRLVDREGTLYTGTSVSRSQEATQSAPALTSVELEPGAAASGLLFFEIVDGAAPAKVAYTDGFQLFTLLADLGDGAPAEGEPVILYDERGEEIGAISVDELIPELEETSDAFDVPRGETVLGAVVTIENTSDGPIAPVINTMSVVDEFGYLYRPTTYFRPEEETADLPDFPTEDIEAGDSASGLVIFALPTVVLVSSIVFIPDGARLFIVARPGDGSVVSGDTLTPIPPVVEATEPADDTPVAEATETGPDGPAGDETPVASGACADLAEWSEGTNQNLAVLDEIDVLASESLEGVTEAAIRDAATQVRDAAASQGELDTPELAGDANDAIVTFLESLAEVLEEGADAVGDGGDPADIFAEEDVFAEDSDLGLALVELVTAQGELQSACPDLDFGL